MTFNVVTPETIPELLEQLALNRGRNFRFGAGYTDLLPDLKKQPPPDLTVINLSKLADDWFNAISEQDGVYRIGALTTAASIVKNDGIKRHYPVLFQAAESLASRQIRNVATVGGNICTASPAGDIACAFVALEAECDILASDGGVRTIPLEKFITGVRKTVLKKDEILHSVTIKPNQVNTHLHSGFIKVGVRRSMEIAVVSLAYHIQVDDKGIIVKTGAGIGSVAPTIPFVKSACDYLIGKSLTSLTEDDSNEFANRVLDYASPISDIRASEWYRKEVLFNISRSIFENL